MSFRYSQSSFWKLKFLEAVAQKTELIPALGKSCSALQVPVSSGASCHHLGDKTVSMRWSLNFLSFKLLLPLWGNQKASISCWVWCCVVKRWFLSSWTRPGCWSTDNFCVCKCVHVWRDSPVPKAVWWLNCDRRLVLLWNICCLLYIHLPGFL